MLIQQLCALFDIPIFNYRVGELSTFKLNSLASEPSYFGKILTILMISFVSIKEYLGERQYNLRLDFKEDNKIWMIFLYQMLFCGSSFAFLLLFVFLFRIIRIKPKTILISAIVLVLIGTVIANLQLVVLERITKVGQALLTLDAPTIFESDQSGAFRIVPTFIYLNQINIFNLDFWLGSGVDFTRSTMPTLMPALDENNFNVGLFPAFIWDFGFINTLLLIYLVLRFAIKKNHILDLCIWLLVVLDAPFNTQLFWISLILMTTNKFFSNQHPFENQLNVQKNLKIA